MLTLINANRMRPPIAPVGLDYVASAVRQAGFDADLLDLSLADDPGAAMGSYFAARRPGLVGVSFRNVDDSFWPSMAWFVPQLKELRPGHTVSCWKAKAEGTMPFERRLTVPVTPVVEGQG